MTDQIQQEVDKLATRVQAFCNAMDPAVAEDAILNGWTDDQGRRVLGLRQFDERYQAVAAPQILGAMRAEHEANLRLQYDGRLRVEGPAIKKVHASIMQSFETVLGVVRAAPRETNAQVDSARELAALQ